MERMDMPISVGLIREGEIWNVWTCQFLWDLSERV